MAPYLEKHLNLTTRQASLLLKPSELKLFNESSSMTGVGISSSQLQQATHCVRDSPSLRHHLTGTTHCDIPNPTDTTSLVRIPSVKSHLPFWRRTSAGAPGPPEDGSPQRHRHKSKLHQVGMNRFVLSRKPKGVNDGKCPHTRHQSLEVGQAHDPNHKIQTKPHFTRLKAASRQIRRNRLLIEPSRHEGGQRDRGASGKPRGRGPTCLKT